MLNTCHHDKFIHPISLFFSLSSLFNWLSKKTGTKMLGFVYYKNKPILQYKQKYFYDRFNYLRHYVFVSENKKIYSYFVHHRLQLSTCKFYLKFSAKLIIINIFFRNHLQDILTVVNNTISKCDIPIEDGQIVKTMPSYFTSLTRKLYFFPENIR